MRYKLLSNLHIDGIYYPEGFFLELEDKLARPLLANGTIAVENKPFSKDNDATVKISLDS